MNQKKRRLNEFGGEKTKMKAKKSKDVPEQIKLQVKLKFYLFF